MVASFGPQLVKSRQVTPAASQLLHVGLATGRPGHGQQLVPSMAIVVGGDDADDGRPVEPGGGNDGRMPMCTGSEIG